jgi:hypothetical protein
VRFDGIGFFLINICVHYRKYIFHPALLREIISLSPYAKKLKDAEAGQPSCVNR